MSEAYICDAIRTPIGRYGGALASVRTDDLAAVPLKALIERNKAVNWSKLDDVIYGCANQAGEDNRNVARMAALLSGLPADVPGATVNRLCGSGMEAVAQCARAIRTGEAELMIAGGVESMSRAPFVMPKAEAPFSRAAEIYDTTIGWRFVNPLMKARYGINSMPETGENVAEAFQNLARRSGRLCTPLASARRACHEERRPCRRDRACRDPATEGRAPARARGRASAPGHHARGACQTADPLPQGRHRDRRQRVRRE